MHHVTVRGKAGNSNKFARQGWAKKDELLKYAVENGIIDLLYVQEQIEMNKRKELLGKHPYKIWEGKDGNIFRMRKREGG